MRRVALAKDRLRLGAWLGLRGGVAAIALAVGSQTAGGIGTAVVVASVVVLGYVAVLALHVGTVRLEVIPHEIGVRSALLRRTYRLARGPVTRLHVPKRGVFGTQLGGFGMEVGFGRTPAGEEVDVVRLSATESLIVVPTTGRRLAVRPADEEDLVEALLEAAPAREPRSAGQPRSR